MQAARHGQILLAVGLVAQFAAIRSMGFNAKLQKTAAVERDFLAANI